MQTQILLYTNHVHGMALSEKSFRAQVQALGRIVIPKEIRDTELIAKGDFVDVIVKPVEKNEEPHKK